MGCKPDPFKFKIVHSEIVNENTIIIANYGGETFNGDKLMLLRGVFDVDKLESLDPHFLDEDYAVVARFVPTKEGLELARLCADSIIPRRERYEEVVYRYIKLKSLTDKTYHEKGLKVGSKTVEINVEDFDKYLRIKRLIEKGEIEAEYCEDKEEQEENVIFIHPVIGMG